MGVEDKLKGKKTLKVHNILDDIEKDEVKKRVDIITLFSSFGVVLTQRGKGFTGLCPWHADKSPSLSVDRQKGLYNCFGCGESGDVVSLVEKMKGYTFREAITYLKKEGTLQPLTPPPTAQEATTKQLEIEEEQKKALPITVVKAAEPEVPLSGLSLSTICEYYHKRLYESAEALAYLKKRGLGKGELYKRFNLGYADGSLLPKVTKGEREHLKALGILRENGGEHLAGCITIPLYDEGGQVAGMYGRKIRDEGEVKHLYLSGGHKGLLNGKAAKVYEELILSESILDGLSLIALGFENVLPLYGASGFTPLHLGALKAGRVKTVTLALDSDEAGRKATDKLKAELLKEGFSVKVLFPPEVKDWNEYLSQGGSRERVAELLKASESLFPPNMWEAFSGKKEGERYIFTTGGLTYSLRGVNEGFVTSLKVFVKAEREGMSFSDHLDLCSYRSRLHFAELLASRFRLGEAVRVEADLSRMLEYLEGVRDKLLSSATGKEEYSLSAEEKRLGEEFLAHPKLFVQILSDMEALGCAGEEENKLLVYLSAVSRLLDKPLSVYVQSTSGMGKSFLLETLRKLLPPESVKVFTSFSDQSLNYLSEEFFLERVFMIGEAIHNEIVEAQIRQMQSENELSRLVTLKDPRSGELRSQEIRHKVRLSFMMSSTALSLNPENASRCLVLHVDESEGQDERISRMQLYRETAEGQSAEKYLSPQIIKKHQAAFRCVEKLAVFGPLAPAIRYPRLKRVRRRSQQHFLTLVKAVALLRQKQKERVRRTDPVSKAEVVGIEWDREDFAIASRLFNEAVLKQFDLELPAPAVELYSEILRLVRKKAEEEGLSPTALSFIQREVRELSHLGSDSVKRYLRLLVEREYLEVVAGRSHGTRFSYRLREDASIKELELKVSLDEEEVEKILAKAKAGETPIELF